MRQHSLPVAFGGVLITAGLWVAISVPVAAAVAFLVVGLAIVASLRDMAAVACVLGGIQGFWFYLAGPRLSYHRLLCFGLLSAGFLGSLGFLPVFSDTHILVSRQTFAFLLGAAAAGGAVAGVTSAHVLYLRLQGVGALPLTARVSVSVSLLVVLVVVDYQFCWPLISERVGVPELSHEDIVALSAGNAKGSQWTGCYAFIGKTPLGLGGASGLLRVSQSDGVLRVEDASHNAYSGGVDSNGRFWFGAEIEAGADGSRTVWRGRFRGDSFEFNRRFTVINGLNALGTNPLRGTGKLSPCP